MALSKQITPTKNLTEFLAYAKRLGYHVGEHPAYGGVTRSVHRPGSWHGDGLAADINWPGSDERAKLLELIPVAESYGLALTFARDGIEGSAANHRTHLHVDVGEWSNYGKGAVRAIRSGVSISPMTWGVGSTGVHVTRLQREMNRVFPAYSRLAVDGVFGPLTEKAVREFQRRAGIAVDGIVGPVTREQLRKYGVSI